MISRSKYQYHVVALGGTFDRFHKGHKYFISEAFKLGEKGIIGLTSDKYVERKFQISKSKFQINAKKYNERKNELETFLQEKKLLDRAEIVEIHDVYGPALSDDRIEALVITKDSQDGGYQVNDKRKQLGKRPLQLIRVALINAQDRKTIASTRIRLGEIDRSGKVYKGLPLWGHQISENLRKQLKKPISLLLPSGKEKIKEKIRESEHPIIITVGDEVTKACNQLSLGIDIAVIDFVVQRKPTYTNLHQIGFHKKDIKNVIKVKNNPGSISKSLVRAIYQSLIEFYIHHHRSIIRVIGEEDLAALPAILFAPLGSIVLYGQPNEGVVVVYVDEKVKKRLTNLMSRYDISS